MKVSKIGIGMLIFTLILVGAAIANLVVCINPSANVTVTESSLPIGIGFVVIALAIFGATLVKVIKEAKQAGNNDDYVDDDDDDDDE